MLGDPRQKQSIEAGGMYATIAATLPETVVRLYETRRQENLEERAVLAFLHDSRRACQTTIWHCRRVHERRYFARGSPLSFWTR